VAEEKWNILYYSILFYSIPFYFILFYIHSTNPDWPGRFTLASLRRQFFKINLKNPCYFLASVGMFISDPGSSILSIPDPGSKNRAKKEREEKKLLSSLFCSHKITKLKIILFLSWWRKKNVGQLQRIIKLLRFGIRVRDPEKTYSQ
jgi:hypothetical protein